MICGARMKTKHLINFKNLYHDMIFGSLEKQETIAKNYQIILKARNYILDDKNDDQTSS